ncbi:hypothetical protein [Pasteurella bettyae]|uniref:Uncharacterized protein n=1 Tax=Pasteurella bettyae CCUG 2042 TaxID=1095749 RepID=I3D6X0_9PAST|nr:hypothetical protein HMPREF1052_1982 [Pasteurella bettyae CCUG 2042]SUB21824.1 Uncharacterised protein [Pasteurella bettyae]
MLVENPNENNQNLLSQNIQLTVVNKKSRSLIDIIMKTIVVKIN